MKHDEAMFQLAMQVSISVIEVYCEKLRDLLAPGNDDLAIHQDVLKGIMPKGATEAPVRSEAEIAQARLIRELMRGILFFDVLSGDRMQLPDLLERTFQHACCYVFTRAAT